MTYLKLQNKTILEFDLDELIFDVKEPQLLPFSLRGKFISSENLAADNKTRIKQITSNNDLLKSFFYNRSLSVKRENAKFIMNQLNIKQNNDFESRYKAMILCKALSATDDYWITNNTNELWENVNVRSNPLHETLQQISLFGRSLSITGKIISPELTNQGAYAKAWYRENNNLYLFKANTNGGDECKREVLASNILDCFNVPHVRYELTEKDGIEVSKCKNFNLETTSIIPAVEFDEYCSRNDLDFFDEVKKIDQDLFYKTIVIDYLIANRDRHEGNWGFYMDNTTGQIIGMHPLFDHNNSFDVEFMKDETGGFCQLIPGKNQREAALYAIKKCDLRLIQPIDKSMFYTQLQYDTFMKRAEELGFYKNRKPVSLKENNVNEYWNRINSNISNLKEQKKQVSKINVETPTLSNEEINFLITENKKLKKILYEECVVTVNGIQRTCKEGLIKGFGNVVQKLDEYTKQQFKNNQSNEIER